MENVLTKFFLRNRDFFFLMKVLRIERDGSSNNVVAELLNGARDPLHKKKIHEYTDSAKQFINIQL